ncbi:hypothetical protein [Longivirga aurantiaca]|uniref:Uncharacterized protein n=1 Tax=Longivirga aurantiaca TaxID=1837743 RepID=A0ABW1T2Z0_9ACTN
MTLITGFAETKSKTPDGMKAGRRVVPAAVVIGIGTAHAVHDDWTVEALCGVTMVDALLNPEDHR